MVAPLGMVAPQLGSLPPGQHPGKAMGPLTNSGDKRIPNHISSEVQIRPALGLVSKSQGICPVLRYLQAFCFSLGTYNLLGWCQGAGKKPEASLGSVSVSGEVGQGERPSAPPGHVWGPVPGCAAWDPCTLTWASAFYVGS